MKELMISLLLWIGTNSTLMVEKVILPQVEFVSSEEMHRMFGMGEDCGGPTVKALYQIEDKIIYLQEDWDQYNLIDKSFLLHELIHHSQKLEGYECREKREEEAYELQFKYLKENAIDNPKEVLHINDMFYIIMTTCSVF